MDSILTAEGEHRAQLIKQMVRRGYSDKQVIREYSLVGLWDAEEILIQKYFAPNVSVLDIGCGAGRTSIPLAQQGYRVTAIDLSPGMIRKAQKQARIYETEVMFLVMDAMDMRFPDASFDHALFSYNGIELIPGMAGKRKVIQEAQRVLKLGGCFIFTTHSIFALNRWAPYRAHLFLKFCMAKVLHLTMKEKEIGERLLENEQEVPYLQIVSPAKFKNLLQETGFELIYFNSRKRIEKAKKPGPTANFDDSFKFYVAKKIA